MTAEDRKSLSLLMDIAIRHVSNKRQASEINQAIVWIEQQFKVDSRRRKKRGKYVGRR